MINSIKLLFKTSRPISWINTAYPFAIGYLLAGGNTDLLFWLASFYFLIPYNLLLYGINDVFDYESDLKNPRKGGIEGAIAAKKTHPLIIWASILTNTPFIIGLIALGTTASNLTLAGVIFFVIAYSAKYLRFKEIPVLDSITSSLHFVGPLIYAASIFAFPVQFWPYILAFFLWGIASHAYGAVQDILPDRQAGIGSVATIFGARATVRLSVLVYGLSCLVLALQGSASLLISALGSLYIFNILPMWNISDSKSATSNKAWKRFLWINYLVGVIITMTIILTNI